MSVAHRLIQSAASVTSYSASLYSSTVSLAAKLFVFLKPREEGKCWCHDVIFLALAYCGIREEDDLSRQRCESVALENLVFMLLLTRFVEMSCPP